MLCQWDCDFCAATEGNFVLGQEQDGYGNRFDSKQANNVIVVDRTSEHIVYSANVCSQYDVIECLCKCHCDLFIYLGRAYSHPVGPTHPRSLSQVKNLVSQSPRAVVSLVGLAAVHALYRRSHLGFLSD